MRIAVTGSSGFIGSKLTKALQKRNHCIIKLDIAEGMDILNFEQLKNVPEFDACVHLAANSFVPSSYERPRDFYHLNINGVINLLEICRKFQARFVFSSSYVYGSPNYLPISEDHPLNGFNPYSETKIIGERLCENYFRYFNVPSIILRPFNIYGSGQNPKFLIPIILEQAKTGKIDLLDPNPKRDYVFIDDVVEAFVKAVEFENKQFVQVNVGSGKSHSVSEVVQIVNTLYYNKLKITYANNKRINEVDDTVADISKISKLLNWQPQINLTDGLTQMIIK
ncbi:MAG TPA: hypothetical protein DIC42_05625 [Holosporales bacterium]|nr:hypothetical protein [Holosporales bacterium]